MPATPDRPPDAVPEDEQDDVDALLAGPLPATPHSSGPRLGERAGEPRSAAAARDGTPTTQQGVGSWFQPLAGGVLPLPVEHGGRLAALVVGRGGDTVHAVTGGVVERATPGGPLVLRTGPGWQVTVDPEAPVPWHVDAGDEVAPGGGLGLLPTRAPDDVVRVVVGIDDAAGRPMAAHELLAGLADPAELGGAPSGGGLLPPDGDPFALDIELARAGRRAREGEGT